MNAHIVDRGLFDVTLQLVRVRMRRKGDFPSLGASIQRIQAAMRNDLASDSQLVEAILGDVALTKKTLRLANSAMYAAFGTEVSTVTQALHVLGTDAVGHLATSLKLIGQMEKAAGSARGELSRSVAAGMVSRSVASTVSGVDGEEATVATLLQRVGWLLVHFYLPEQVVEIRRHMEAGHTEASSEVRTLGAPAWVLGHAVGRDWGLPAALCEAMNPAQDSGDPHTAWVAAVSSFAHEFVDGQSLGRDGTALATRFATSIGCEPSALLKAATQAVKAPEVQDFLRVASEAAAEPGAACKPFDCSVRLEAALRDLRAATETLRVDHLINMAAELVHRAMGFNRTLFFLRNGADRALRVKIALGAGSDSAHALAFDEAFSPNVFNLALSNQRSVFIAEAQEAGIRKRLPQWYVQAMENVRSFLLIPVCLGARPLGLLYADWADNARGCSLDAREMSRLEAVRLCMLQGFAQMQPVPAPAPARQRA